ncbi:MFS transporter [Scytonema sp. PRP1]|uniref:MFS transporter n=1 Tax=Scytonema sp. PRP1 TaxID=3120513 RepID=UPI002FD328CE
MNLSFLKQKLNLPAFQSRNYQLYFLGQGLSLMGTWMTQVATVWVVYHLTKSALMLGLVGFVTQIPNFILVPFGGVLVDRWNHHRTLLVTQTLSMLESFALAVLTLTGTLNIWHLIGLGFFQGLVNAVDAPTRQAFVPEIVEGKKHLVNAIALNSSMVNGAKLVGPALGGVILASIGAGYCFLIDGFSYFAVLIALLAMQLKPPTTTRIISPLKLAHIWQNLKEGFVYAFNFPIIRSILLLTALVSFMGINYAVILPIFAAEILHGSAHTLGILMASTGVGALLAAISLSQRHGVRGLGRIIAIATILVGVSMVVFSLSRALWLSALLLVFIGFGTLLQTASSNTILQTLIEDGKRGRVMSLYLVAFLGMMPFGNLFKGSLISLIGASETVAFSGGVCILGGILFAQQLPKLRQQVLATHPQLISLDEK